MYLNDKSFVDQELLDLSFETADYILFDLFCM